MYHFKRSNLTGRIMYNIHEDIYICSQPIEFEKPEAKRVHKVKIQGVWRDETHQDRIMMCRDGIKGKRIPNVFESLPDAGNPNKYPNILTTAKQGYPGSNYAKGDL